MHHMHISTNEISSVMLGPKKLEIRKQNLKTAKEPIKAKQSDEIEPNSWKDRAMHEGDNPSF